MIGGIPARLGALAAVAALVAGCLGDDSLEPLPPGPPVDCRAIPAVTCQQIVDDARRNADPGTAPVRIRAVCTTMCTPRSGDVQVDVRYSDGRRQSYGMSWTGAEPGAGQAPAPAPSAPPPSVPGSAAP